MVKGGLREPNLGPIVGHTTATSSRIWIRGADPGDEGHELTSHRRTVGVIAVLEEDGKPPKDPRLAYFRLHREFDRTGSFDLGRERSIGADPTSAVPLAPDTKYTVGLGTLSLDDPFDDDEHVSDEALKQRLPPLAPWMIEALNELDESTRACFRTFPATAATPRPLSFVLGSCRYPGVLWQAKRADRIFGPIVARAMDEEQSSPVRFALMVGDQIYADELNRNVPVGRADTFGEFQQRYLTAFGSLNMSNLLRRLPTYMILDDHEIEDNWTQDRIRDDGKHVLFNLAISAYMSYQWSHGPRTFGRALYYTFECDGHPFFVLDTRTQRFKDDIGGLPEHHMLGRPGLDPNEPSQIDHLLAWMRDQQKRVGDAPKFIVTSSVFVPNFVSERWGPDPQKPAQKRLENSDAWPAYPTTRRTILDAIVKDGIQNVVFLAGDVHCSNVAALSFIRGGDVLPIKAFAITSSAFYWPFPFADGNPADFVHDSTKPGQEDVFPLTDGTQMHYLAWNFTQDDNYCVVDVDPKAKRIDVNVFGSDGQAVKLPSGNPSIFGLA
jgi:alkaline phosphatase D